MKFYFDRNSMINEIAIAQEIISIKNQLSVLSNVLLIAENNTLTIRATDIKVNFQTKIPVAIEEEGSTTIFCDKFMSILNSLPEGEIEFSIQEKDFQVLAVIRHSTKKIKFNLKCMADDKFPEIAIAEKVSFTEIPAKEFKSMILKTSFATSTDEERYLMNGVHFEKKENNLVLVATDGKLLAIASKEIFTDGIEFSTAIVHPKILNVVAKHLSDEGNISVAIVDKMIFLKFENHEFSATLIDGQYPNYERVIPSHQASNFKVDKSELLSALKRISLMSDRKSGMIIFTVSPGVLTISSQEMNIGNAKEEIPCEYAGDEFVIALNHRYVEDSLKVMDCERIAIEFTQPNRAITLKAEPADDYFYIIMPISL